MFYKDNRKIIPRNLSDYLTPLVLAVWFLNEPRQTISICNFRVNRADMEYLSFILKNKYNIDTSIQSKGKKIGESIYIKSSSIAIFRKIVKPHILPSLHYKLKSPEIKLSLFSGHAFSFSYAGFNSKLGIGIRMFSTKKDSNSKYTTEYKKQYKLSSVQKQAEAPQDNFYKAAY